MKVRNVGSEVVAVCGARVRPGESIALDDARWWAWSSGHPAALASLQMVRAPEPRSTESGVSSEVAAGASTPTQPPATKRASRTRRTAAKRRKAS